MMNFQIMSNRFMSMVSNPIFLAAVASWVFSQCIKTLIRFFTSSIESANDLFDSVIWRTGGMPSSHSALVASLTTTIGFKAGFDSDLFIFAFFSAIIVIRDAVGVRRSSGIQAKFLNDLGQKLSEEGNYTFKPVKEVQGHEPIEVLAGILLGFLIGIGFSLLS